VDFDSTMRRFESSGPSQPVRRSEKSPLIVAEMPANSRLLRLGYRSPDSVFCHFGGENAENLRPHAGLFPFSGDRDRRLVSIITAWRTSAKRGYSSSCAVSAMAGVTPPFGAMRSAGARSTAPHKERDPWQENWKARLPS
jgi:hypothetical protein